MIAVLFADPTGIYSTIPGVDLWDETRDARKYGGPYPVVAHPPCHLWTNLAHVNFKRYGGEHNRPENDGGCFVSALTSVNTFGGVLEHPAFSRAWDKFGLPRPVPGPFWTAGPRLIRDLRSYTCEVYQSAYGHKAQKRTWLYYVGRVLPFELRWDRIPGTHQCGWFDRNKPTLGKKEASATPPAFAATLVALALHSKGIT